jgi:hypothetical protein
MPLLSEGLSHLHSQALIQVDPRFRFREFGDYRNTAAFIAENYQRFKHLFGSKHEKKPKPVTGINGLYSLKRLFEM